MQEVWDAESVQKLETNNKTLADMVAMEIGLIGENMAVARAAFMRGSKNDVIGSFVHASGILEIIWPFLFIIECIHWSKHFFG